VARSVLVVDDAAFMRMMIRDILTREGFVVHEAVNGRDAVEKYREIRPDLVTMDIAMPEMDGLAAVRNIRSEDPSACILMVSAMGAQDTIDEALDLGAADYLVKPFQPARMLIAVKRCLQAVPRC
jgi:two-component system chemotaxis response regulator CheY